MKTLLIILLFPFCLHAQIPADFTHVWDSIQFVADPVNGGKQVVEVYRNKTFTVPMPSGWFKVFVATKNSAGTFEKFLHFSQIKADSISTSSNPTLNVQVMTGQFLLLIPLQYGTSPVVRDGKGKQIVMYKNGLYWYCYVRRTAQDQKFSFNPTNAYNQDISFEPIPGNSLLYVPKDKTITINVIETMK